ncbi:arginyltransferase [Vibrio gangliei]|uniref:arginyltransferase n=1 Tax=Vibrio gangliei TaxID=2077090 RepID=UPI000D015A41|nr:arginyltransferase [Vibrio gangliei]
MQTNRIKIGLSPNHPCSYLPEQQERIAVLMDDALHTEDNYAVFLANGFRRSGNMVYKPHCQSCQACQPIRVAIADIQWSKSQKRLLNKTKHFTWEFKTDLDENWFELYERYIEKRHRNGSMYPANQKLFHDFIFSDWLTPKLLHVYEDGKLIAVAVTDDVPYALSAFYTFYEPEHPLSLGTLCVLLQIKQCQKMQKDWLYLGYQIDECPAMSYKVRFQRHQKLVNQRWQG